MGLWDNIKNILTIPEDDEFEEEFNDSAESKSAFKKTQTAEPNNSR